MSQPHRQGRVITTYARRKKRAPSDSADQTAKASRCQNQPLPPAQTGSTRRHVIPPAQATQPLSSDSDSSQPQPKATSSTSYVATHRGWRRRSIRESIAQLTRLYESDQATATTIRPTKVQPVLRQGCRSPRLSRYSITTAPTTDVFGFCPEDYDDGPQTPPALEASGGTPVYLEAKSPRNKVTASRPLLSPRSTTNYGSAAFVAKASLPVSPSKRKAAPHAAIDPLPVTTKPITATAEPKPTKVSRLTRSTSHRTTAHNQIGQPTTRPRLDRRRPGQQQQQQQLTPASQKPATHLLGSPTTTKPSAPANQLTRSQSAHSLLATMPLDAPTQALPTVRTSVKITYGKGRSFQGHESTQVAATSYWDYPEQQEVLAPTRTTSQQSPEVELASNPGSNPTLALEHRQSMHEINALLTDIQRHHPLPQRQQACVRLARRLATVSLLIPALGRTSKAQQLYNTLHLQADPLIQTTWLYLVYHLFTCPTIARRLITERQALDVVADYLRPHREDLLQVVAHNPATASTLAGELVGIIDQSLRDPFSSGFETSTPHWSWRDLALRAVCALCLGKSGPAASLNETDATFAPCNPYPLGLDQPVQVELRISGCLAFLAQIVVDQVPVLVSLQPDGSVQPEKLANTLQALDPLWRCVSVLEYATVSVTENVADLLGQHLLLERLVQLLEVYGQQLQTHHLLAGPKGPASQMMANKTLVARCINDSLVVIRLLVNLTNQQPEACLVLSQPPFVRVLGQMLGMSQWLWPRTATAPSGRKSMRTRGPDSLSCYRNLGLDCVMLTVGLLINLVEESPGARDCLREVAVGPPHINGNTTHSPLLKHATDLFVHLQTTLAPVEEKVLTAYLAMLLGCSMDANATNQRLIRQWLPGHSFACITELLDKFLGPNPSLSGASPPPEPMNLASLSMVSPVLPADALSAALQDPTISTEALLNLHSQGGAAHANQTPSVAHASHDESDVIQSFRRIARLLKRLDEPSQGRRGAFTTGTI
ncbi:hypothetical protein H4R34_001482 [Dimargaris verticillata]|uniref:Wings apart-like protein C-terminal domain-containing protein n=1 Tax=Dimargaris verticillata TaxID=2761393 RepID=A0A9W8EA95_9FUNG|nr:hypothetical protein H4R34_001482 [Dimargaris verticillata]